MKKKMSDRSETSFEFRNSPLQILKKLGKLVWFIITLAIIGKEILMKALEFFLSSNSLNNRMIEIVLGIFFVIIVLMIAILISYYMWRNTIISIDDTHFYYDKVGIFKKHISVPLKHIANCNFNQSLFEQICRVYTVKLDINSSKLSKNTDFEMLLNKEEAEKIRSIILEHQKETLIEKEQFSQEKVEIDKSQKVSYENVLNVNTDNVRYHLSFRDGEVMKNAFLSISPILIFASLIGIALFFRDILSPEKSNEIQGILGILGVLVITIIPAGYQSMKNLTKFYQFHAIRYDRTIKLQYGLLSKNEFVIDINKINSIEIQQKILPRIFGYYELSVNSIGVGDENEESANISLYVKMDKLKEIIKGLIPEFEESYLVERQEKVVFFYYIATICIWLIPIAILLEFIVSYWWTFIVWIGLMVIILLRAILAYITPGILVKENQMIVRSGVFTTVLRVIPVHKIEMIHITDNIITHKMGLCRLSLFTKGEILKRVTETGLFPRTKFTAILSKYTS